MKYLSLILFILLSNSIFAQSISYGIGIGLPYSTIDRYNNLVEFKKSTEYAISVGFKNSKSNRDFTEIRFSTFLSQLEDNDFPDQYIYTYSVRKYLIGIQKYFLELDLRKLGTIDLGSGLSLLLTTNKKGIYSNSTSGQVQINSVFRENKRFRFHFLAKYSIGSFKLNDRFRLRPIYTFSYTTSDDNNFPSSLTRRSAHTFELTFITNLSIKK